MLAKRELRQYSGDIRVWVGKYRNLTNLPHWHYDCEIIHAEKGGADIFINGKAVRLCENGGIFIASREAHSIKADDGSVLAFFLFDHSLVKKVIDDRALRSPLLAGDYRLNELFSLIDGELSSSSPLRSLSVNNRIERLILDVFSREKLREGAAEESYHETAYKKLLSEIDNKYENFTLADAARFLSISESYCSKLFKKMADMTFSQYLNLVRVEKAIEMMRSEKCKITKVAINCGFDTIRNFNRVFKKITGYSPKQLPPDYNTLGMHPTYGVEETFDPTDKSSVLIK